MVLGFNDIKVTDVKQILEESYSSVGYLCTSNKINQWSWYKPADYGYWFDGATHYYNSVQAHDETPPVPAQGVANGTSGYRLGDFRGYDHNAKAPLTFEDFSELPYNNYGLIIYYDINTNDGHLTPYLTRGQMPACTNTDGFNPDFVADQESIDLIPEIWQGATLKYTGGATTINYTTIDEGDYITLSTLNPTGLTAGTNYTLKVKQKNGALNQGYIQETTPFIVESVLAYGISPSPTSYLWYDSGAPKQIKMSGYLVYDQISAPDNTTLKIVMTITNSEVYYKDNGLTTISGTTSATVGTLFTKGFEILGIPATGDTFECAVYNNATDYLYDTFYLTI